MSKLPKIPYTERLSRLYRVNFGGLNHVEGTKDGEIYDMKNMTSDRYPVLSPRKKRRVIRTLTKPNGMICYGEHTAWVDGTGFYFDGVCYGGVSDGLKQMAVLNQRVLIFPDKKYFDMRTAESKGQYATVEALSTAVTSPAPNDYYLIGTQEPENGYLYLYGWNGKIWEKLGQSFGNMAGKVTNPCLFWRAGSYKGASALNNKITGNSVNWANDFNVGDAVTISGATEPENNKTAVIREIDGNALFFDEDCFVIPPVKYQCKIKEDIPHRPSSGVTIPVDPNIYFTIDGVIRYFSTSLAAGDEVRYDVGQTYVVVKYSAIEEEENVPVTVDSSVRPSSAGGTYILNFEPVEYPPTSGDETLTLERVIPDLDYVFTSHNRLWGGKGDMIYGSKLGDPLNFNVFDGLSTDSYSVALGSAGDITGALDYGGYPTFFKENGVFKLYGDYPSNFQIVGSMRLGVREGCGGSLAVAGERLFYISRNGVMVYSGGAPTRISEPLGKTFIDGVGVSDGRKYYLSAYDGVEWGLYVYDTDLSLWHKEDDLQMVDADFSAFPLALDVSGRMVNLNPSGVSIGTEEEVVAWVVEFGDMTVASPMHKGVSKLNLRVKVPTGSTMTAWLMFDSDGLWRQVKTLNATGKHSENLPIVPRRGDHFRVKVTGSGDVCIYGLTVQYRLGSDYGEE